MLPEDGSYFSTALHRAFRSSFEARVAERLVFHCGFHVRYESHQFPLDINGAYKIYIPDFYLPDFGVWIEAKGVWMRGGEAKFRSALRVLTANRLLLINPAHMTNKNAEACTD